MPAHKVVQPVKHCRVCGVTFSKPPHNSQLAWSKRETCSKVCGATHKNNNGDYKVQAKICIKCKKTFVRPKKDTYEHFARQLYCSISCSKIGKFMGEDNFKWAGEHASYSSLHKWIRANFGKPQFCEHCKTSSPRMYHWANISSEYKRDRNDWIRLCVPCHKKYDLTQKT